MLKFYSITRVRRNLSRLFLMTAILLMANGLYAQVNIAPSAVASASTCNTGPCSALNNGIYGTCGTQEMWISTSGPPAGTEWLEYTWANTQVMNKITIHHAQTTGRFLAGGTIQVWNGSAYVNHFTFSGLNQANCINDVTFPVVATTRLRITAFVMGTGQNSNPNFREIEVWQSSLSNNDIGVTSIDSVGTVCSTTPLPIYATITNYGKNVVTSANVLWSVNGAIQGTVPFTGTLDTLGGAGSSTAAISLGSYGFSTAPATIKVWTSQPNGTADTVKVNDTSAVVKSVALAAGTYTIGGTGANYPTFTSAIADLYARGICGPVTYLVSTGTYNEQITLSGVVTGSSPINTIIFKGNGRTNTILNFASTNSNARHTVLLTQGARFITFRDMTIQGNGNFSGDFAFPIIMNGAGTRMNRIANCNVQIVGPNSLSGTTNYIPIVLGGNSASYSTSGRLDSIDIDSNTIRGGYFGVVSYGTAGNGSTNVKFRNNILNDVYYYGIFLTNYDNLTLENNSFNMQTATTGVTPVYVSTATATNGRHHRIVGNRIPTFGSYAMYLLSISNQVGNKGLIANNVIGGNCISTTGYGLYLSNPTNFMFYHNTVNMGNSGTTNQAYAGIYVTSGSANSFVNNNLSRTAPGMGLPLYISSAIVVDTMNYNNFFKADTASALIFVGSALFPANFVGASGFNTNSTFLNPGYINPMTNLNITNGCNNGVSLPQVPTDVNGVARASAPDMGAFEILSVGNNLSIERIYAPTASFTPGSADVWALVRNLGTNSVSTYTVGYTNNGGTPVTQTISTAIASCDTASVYFQGASQVTLGTSNTLKVFTANPNASIDSMPANDTLVGNYFTPLAGTYTIGGSSANFLNFTAAANALKSTGVSGPVTFIVNPGTYNEVVNLETAIPGLWDSTKIEFVGVNKNTVIIEGNRGSAPMVMIMNNKYITFRNITIRNLSPSGGGFSVVGTTVNNNGTGCNIINCVIDMPNYTTGTAYPILYTGTTSGFGVSAMRADSITIDSNTLNGSYYAITVYGASNALYNRFIRIRNNTVTNCYYMGAYIAYNYNAITFTNNTFDLNPAFGIYGVYYYYNQNSSTTVNQIFANNKVNNYGNYGYYIIFPSTSSATVAENFFVNNMAFSGPSYNGVYGMYLQDNSASRSRVYNNTLVNRFPNTQATYAPFYFSGSTNVMVKNNIFAHLAGAGCPAYFATSPATGNVNHNIYFNTANASLVYRNGTYFNASNYKTATAGGDTSYNMNPGFVSATDLHTTNACMPRGADFSAIFTTDIDGDTRGIPGMLGADEIVGRTNDLEIVSITSPTAPVSLGAQDLRVLVKNRGTNTVSSFDIAYRYNGGTPVIMSYSGSGLASCDTITMVFTGTNQITIGTGANAIKAYTYNPNSGADNDPSNDTANVSLAPPLVGNYIVGAAPSDFADLNVALAAAQARGLGGRTTFLIKTGVYNGSYTIDNINGASASNTLNITSLAGHRDSVRLEFAVNATTLQTVLMRASFVNFNKITIRQTNGVLTSTNSIINYGGTCNNDTINDCVIWGPIYGVDGTSTSSYSLYNNGSSTNGLVYTNNYIKGSFYGAYFFGNSATYNVANSTFINNLFDSAAYGAFYYLYYTKGSKFINNTFYHRVVTPTYTTGYQYWYYNDSAYTFDNNLVQTVGGKSLYYYNYYSKNSLANPAIVRNNVINGASAFIYWAIGGSITNNYYILNNTVHAGSNYTYLNATGNSNLRILNNIFYSATTYSFYWSAAPPVVSQVNTNNNLYFSTTSTTPIYSAAARTLAAHKTTYLTIDRNSVSYRAPFTSNANLTPNPNDTTVWLINGRGMHDANVPTDINGLSRPANVTAGVPDIGAHEVTPGNGVLAPLATAVPAIPVLGSVQHFILGADSVAKITWDATSSLPNSSSIRYYTGQGPNTQGALGVAINANANVNLSGTGLLYNLDLHYKPYMIGNVSSQTNLRQANYGGSSSWIVNSTSTVDSARFIVSALGITDSSAAWTLTDATNPLTTFLNITGQPASQTKCNGDSATFTVAATGTGLTYQWQVNTGSGFTNITGATTSTLVVNGLNTTFNGNRYRCSITNATGTANSNEATLTMGVQTNITTQPSNRAGCLGDNVTFSTAASGSGLTWQWEENTGSGFTTIAGATSSALIRTNIQTVMSGTTYRAIIAGNCGTRTTDTVSLTVSGPITITTQPTPTSVNVCAGSTVTLSMAATGATTFQWQIDLGSGYTNITGATTSTLNITNIPATYNGGNIRCALTNPCNVAFSSVVPVVVQTPGLWSGVTSTSWTTASNWGCSNVPTSSVDVVIPNSAINMPSVAGSVNMRGLTVESAATITLSGAASNLNIFGNLLNNGTISGSTGWISFAGSTQQTMNGGTYNKVAVNNTTGVKISAPLTVVDTLQLTNGKVQLDNNGLTIGNTGRILGNSANNYVVTNGTGSLTMNNIGTGGRTGAFVFPVGTSSDYSPVTVNNTGSADNYSVRVINGAYPTYTGNTPSGSAYTTNAVAANWIIEEAVSGGSNLSVTFQWNASQELSGFTRASSYVARFTTTGWMANAAGAAAGTGPYTRTMAGIVDLYPMGVGSNGTLPVTWLSFTAKSSGKDAMLNWATGSELNNKGFEVERSFDGENFVSIGFVKGAGSSASVHTYSFVDASVLNTTTGDVYYRLKQVDFDGNSEYSKVAILGSNNEDAISLYPNPFNTEAGIFVSVQEDTKVSIEVKDLMGRSIFVSDKEVVKGVQYINIENMGMLSSGMYLVQVSMNGEVKTFKVQKSN